MKMKYFLAIMFVLCAFWAIDILPVWGGDTFPIDYPCWMWELSFLRNFRALF